VRAVRRVDPKAVSMAMGGWGSVAVSGGKVTAVLIVEGSSHGDRVLAGGRVEYSVPTGRPHVFRAFQESARTRSPLRVFLRNGSGECYDMGLYVVVQPPGFPGARAVLAPAMQGPEGRASSPPVRERRPARQRKPHSGPRRRRQR